eukprot:6203693-Pyramimonas_sp.AAC.1
MVPAKVCDVASRGRPARWAVPARIRHVAARSRLVAAACAGWVQRGFATLPPAAASWQLVVAESWRLAKK